MRKIFLFIGAVLLSVAMQASIETRSLDLSGDWKLTDGGNTFELNKWSSIPTKWGWTVGVDEYEQLIVEVADHLGSDLIITAYFCDGAGSDDVEVAGILRGESTSSTNMIALDIKGPILHGIKVQNFSSTDGLSITVTNMYLRRAVGETEEISLWSEPMVFDDFKTWGNEIVIGAEAFADLHAGDILEINYTLDEAASTYYILKIQNSYDTYFPVFLGTLNTYNQYLINKNCNSNQLHFTITDATDIDELMNHGGIHINGKFLTIYSVKLIHHKTLWQGEQEVTSGWSGYQQIDASKLTDLKVGNIIAVRVSDLTAGGQVFLQYNNGSWTNFDPVVNYVFSGSDEAPMVVEIPITYKLEKQLRGNHLIVKGASFTMTDIFIKEGTPVNTVAEYLNVSAAGIATYILPFDVPTLPDGVEAYTLTNNGDETIWADPVSSIEADKPVLIVAAEGEYEFVSEAGASDDVSGKSGTYTNGALIGTYQAIAPLEQTTGGNYNYVLQNGTDGVAFYQVRSNDISLSPYRAYLSCGYNATTPSSPTPAPMRMVFRPKAPTSIDNTNVNINAVKVLRNGQLFILRNGVEYNVNGQIVK